jgi:hypothetical protein
VIAVQPFFGGSDDPEKQAWLTSDDRFSPEWLQSKQYGAGPMTNPSSTDSTTSTNEQASSSGTQAAGAQQQQYQGNMQDLMQQGTMEQLDISQMLQGNMWGGMQGGQQGMMTGDPYGDPYGMMGQGMMSQQQGMMGQQQGMFGQQQGMMGQQQGMFGQQQGMSPYDDFMPPYGQEADIFTQYEVQDDIIQRYWDDPAAVRFTGIVARMTYGGNQELLEPKYFFLNVNGTVDLGSGLKADVTFDGMDRIGLSDRAFVVKKTKDSLKLDSFNAKDCKLVRGRDGKVEIIKQGDKDISIYQGDSIQFKDDPNYSGYERFDILFHNAPVVQKVPIQWDEDAMTEMDENDMRPPPPPMGGPDMNFGRPKVSPLSLARKRALFAINTKIMSLELLSDEIQAATDVETIEELLEAALETGSPVIDIPSSKKLEERKLGQEVKWEVSKAKDKDEMDEMEMVDFGGEEWDDEETKEEEVANEEKEDLAEQARLTEQEEELRLATEALRRAEEEEARLAEEALSLLSEEQKKIEEAKAKYIRELEEKRVAQLAEKAAAEASLEEALKMDRQAQIDEESVSKPVEDVQLESKPEREEEKLALKTEKKEPKPEESSSEEALKMNSQAQVDEEPVSEPAKEIQLESKPVQEEEKPEPKTETKEPKPDIEAKSKEPQEETRPAADAEMDAKKLRRFRELQKKVEEAHRLLRNPPPDPITSDIKRKQQAARDTIEKAHLTPCFFDTHGGCNDPNCKFLHEERKKTNTAKSNPNKPVSKTYPKATPIPKITTEVTNQRGVLYEWHEKGRKGAFGYIRLDSGEELYCKKESFVKEPKDFHESRPVKVEAILRCDSRKPGQRDEAKNVRFLGD